MSAFLFRCREDISLTVIIFSWIGILCGQTGGEKLLAYYIAKISNQLYLSLFKILFLLFFFYRDTNAELDGLKHQVQNLHKVYFIILYVIRFLIILILRQIYFLLFSCKIHCFTFHLKSHFLLVKTLTMRTSHHQSFLQVVSTGFFYR